MKIIGIIIIVIALPTFTYPQGKSEKEIFETIINNEIERGNSGIYIGCEKEKTFFDPAKLKEQTGLLVPDNILAELQNAEKNSYDTVWSSTLIKNINLSTDFIKSSNCVAKEERDKLFQTNNQRQSILYISQPIFDIELEHCVVSVSYSRYKGSADGHSYFLKKVYGKWVIVGIFDGWIT